MSAKGGAVLYMDECQMRRDQFVWDDCEKRDRFVCVHECQSRDRFVSGCDLKENCVHG